MHRAAVLVIGCLFALAPLHGQSDSIQIPVDVRIPPDGRFAPIRADLVSRIAAGELPSAAVTVIEDGRVVWAEAFGWADLVTRRPATVDTSYLLGSLAKALTSATVMDIIEDEFLSLDDSIEPWVRVRNAAGGHGQVTLRQLLDATAGIPHGWSSYDSAGLTPRTDVEWDDWLEDNIFVAFPPGVVFEYSNNSFGVAARVAERAAGIPFDQLIAERLFQPLGMTSSFARREDVPAETLAVPYGPGPLEFEAYHGEAAPEAGLGMYASVSDLARFGASMLGVELANLPRVLDASTLAQFHQLASGPGRPFFHFGFWNTGRAYVANGNVAGANAHLALIPFAGAVVAVTVNATGFGADEVADQIVDLLAQPESSDNPNSRAAFEALYDTPLAYDAALTGRWSGAIATPEEAIPIIIDVSAVTAVVRVGSDNPIELSNPSFNAFRELRGTLRIPPAALGVDLDSVVVTLRQEGRRLEGYVLLRGSDAIPYPVWLDAESSSNP